MARVIDFVDGVTSETPPTIGDIVASELVQYVDDATYEANEQNAPATGNIYYNTTDNVIRYYNGTSWQSIIDETTTQTVQNKNVDADQNTITNIDNDEIKANAGIDATKIADGSIDNTEYQHLDGVSSNIQTQIDSKQDTSEKDQPNGYAGLDANGRILASVVPEGFVEFQGTWDASTNTPTLVDGTGEKGDVYRTSVAGTQDLGSGPIDFAVGDWVTYNGTVWQRSDFVGAEDLDALSDVDTTGKQDGDALVFNQTSGNWEPGEISSTSQENIALIGKGKATWTAPVSSITVVDDNLSNTNDYAITENIKTGFTFTPSKTGQLASVAAKLVDRGLGNGDGNVQAFLYATSGGLPTGSVLDSSTQLGTSNLTSQTNTIVDNNFIFSGDVELQAGTEYAIAYQSTDTGTVYLRRGDTNEADSQNFVEDSADSETFSLAPTQETLWYEVRFDNIAGVLSLDTDIFISVPPLPDNYHTIQAQDISLNNDQAAYVNIDRDAVSQTNLTVFVDDITNITPDNNKLIILRSVSDEGYFGLHDPIRLQDGDIFDIQTHGNNVEFLSQATAQEPVPSLGVWVQMTGNSIILTPGTWMLTGQVEYQNTGGSGGFGRVRALWALSNGDDTSTAPTSIFNSLDAGHEQTINTINSNLGTCIASIARITVISNTEIFLVPRSDEGTAANQLALSRIYAQRLK